MSLSRVTHRLQETTPFISTAPHPLIRNKQTTIPGRAEEESGGGEVLRATEQLQTYAGCGRAEAMQLAS